MIIKVGTDVRTDWGRGVVTAITDSYVIVKRTDMRENQEDIVVRGRDAIWIHAEIEKGTNCEDGHWQWVPANKEAK